ncbi:hypothetical protein B566_EDAN005876 [Ephemera danica]|nr:hypothetical protein B566_EDAN005876 [Ephemera danica]
MQLMEKVESAAVGSLKPPLFSQAVCSIYLVNCELRLMQVCWRRRESSGMQRGPAPGHFGHYSCDSPWALVQSAASAMKRLHGDNIEFVLWTGRGIELLVRPAGRSNRVENVFAALEKGLLCDVASMPIHHPVADSCKLFVHAKSHVANFYHLNVDVFAAGVIDC